MKIKIFSSKKEANNRTCYLCESTLKDYIQSVPHDYKEFDIQRGIVSNIYLDNLPNTILSGQHMPPITLSTESVIDFTSPHLTDYSIEDFRVLDGLQRTHRLKILWDSIEFLGNVLKVQDISNLDLYQITKQYSDELENIGSDSKTFYYLLSQLKENFNNNIDLMKSKFDNVQWFEIWTNLEPDDEIQKILILNAGHKQMTTQHQIELLFLNQLRILEKIILDEGYEFKLIRERDMSSTLYGKKRAKGMYYFPHFISATLSFIEKKPVTSNINLVKKIQYNESTFDELNEIISYEFIKDLTRFLVKFDSILTTKYDDDGVKWIAKDTVMTGIFGAIGEFAYNTKGRPKEVFEFIIESLEHSSFELLNLASFNYYRNSINIGNVNIGNFTKNAVYNGFKNLIYSGFSEEIDWKVYFEGGF